MTERAKERAELTQEHGNCREFRHGSAPSGDSSANQSPFSPELKIPGQQNCQIKNRETLIAMRPQLCRLKNACRKNAKYPRGNQIDIEKARF